MTRNVALGTRRRPEQARSRRRVEQVLDAARDLIGERGIEPITISEIAERADMAVTALYRYFPNKAAIVRELTVRTLEHDSNTIVIPLLSEDAELGELVRTGVTAYWRRNRDEPFRPNLRAAIHADAELAALDHEDNCRNAAALAVIVAERTGDGDMEVLQRVMLLTLSLLDCLIWLTAQVPDDEARLLVDTYARMITAELRSSSKEDRMGRAELSSP